MEDQVPPEVIGIVDLTHNITPLVLDRYIKEFDKTIANLSTKKDELLKWRNQLAGSNSPVVHGNVDYWCQYPSPWSAAIGNILQTVFHFEAFRNKSQLAALNATLAQKDVILVSPTGAGKSLVFQISAALENKLTLVVAPLLSLIEDQLQHLQVYKIRAKTINGHTSKQDRNLIHAQMIEDRNGTNPGLKLLYVTPEWLAKSKQFMSYLQKCYDKRTLARIVIDEVHCCSMWGHDFRPDYNYLSLLKTMFPKTPILGLTATAGHAIIKDILETLTIPKAVILTEPMARNNLHFQVEPKPEREELVHNIGVLMKTVFKNKSGIIYVMTVKESEEMAHALHLEGLKVKEYHAQLDHESRAKIQRKWYSNHYQAVVATVAFGMGIDKPDVRFVIHISMPKSIEGLYQETGRAGRDGKEAHCLIFYSLNDFLKNISMAMSKKEEERNFSVLEYCINCTECRRVFFRKYLQEGKFPRNKCKDFCDLCFKKRTALKYYDVFPALKILRLILERAEALGESKLTLLKLMSAWFKTGPKSLRNSAMVPKITNKQAEDVIAFFISRHYFGVTKGYNLYSSFSYITLGKRAFENGPIVMPYCGVLAGFKEIEANDEACGSSTQSSNNNKNPRPAILVDKSDGTGDSNVHSQSAQAGSIQGTLAKEVQEVPDDKNDAEDDNAKNNDAEDDNAKNNDAQDDNAKDNDGEGGDADDKIHPTSTEVGVVPGASSQGTACNDGQGDGVGSDDADDEIYVPSPLVQVDFAQGSGDDNDEIIFLI